MVQTSNLIVIQYIKELQTLNRAKLKIHKSKLKIARVRIKYFNIYTIRFDKKYQIFGVVKGENGNVRLYESPQSF